MDDELERLKAAVSRKLADMAIEAEAGRYGAADRDLLFLLIDRTGISVDLESETVIGVSEAVRQIVAEKPYLFAPKIKAPPAPRTKNEELEAIQRELRFKKF
jgi:hypothetical protein